MNYALSISMVNYNSSFKILKKYLFQEIPLYLEIEKKVSSKLQTSIYLRRWNPDSYELGDLQEIILDGNSFDLLIDHVIFD
jgi:hypothetical protein